MSEILLTWWGALDRGGPTVGDALAVVNAERALRSAGLPYTIASDIKLDCVNGPTVNWREVDPYRFDCHLFVCGPVIGGSASFRHLMARFDHCIKIAAGVSMLPSENPDHWNPFDIVVARDGLPESYFDLSLAHGDSVSIDAAEPAPSHNPLKIGLCLRGMQREYGEAGSLHKEAETIIRDAVQRTGASCFELDTRLDRGETTLTQFFAQLQACDVLLTTRLHGLLLSLLCRKLVIALDQIRGGGKVLAAAQTMGWPYAFSVEDVTVPQIEVALGDLINDEGRRCIAVTRKHAIELSASAVQAAISLVSVSLAELM